MPKYNLICYKEFSSLKGLTLELMNNDFVTHFHPKQTYLNFLSFYEKNKTSGFYEYNIMSNRDMINIVGVLIYKKLVDFNDFQLKMYDENGILLTTCKYDQDGYVDDNYIHNFYSYD